MNHDEAKILPDAHLTAARHTCCESAALWASDAAPVSLPDEHIAAILPIYDEHGRGVAVYTSDGGCCVYGLRLRTILAHLAERNCRTLPLIRRRMHLLLGGRQEHPLPISPQLVLVPCKVLTPRVQGDETIGYFSLAQVVRLIAPPAAHGNPPARRHVKQARGKGRPVCHGAPSAPTRAVCHAAPSTPSRLARHAAPSAPPRAVDACPAYELADGRRIPLLATLATARIRLALAAYAKDHMFPQTRARER